jgi:hypothetical protein
MWRDFDRNIGGGVRGARGTNSNFEAKSPFALEPRKTLARTQSFWPVSLKSGCDLTAVQQTGIHVGQSSVCSVSLHAQNCVAEIRVVSVPWDERQCN